MDDVTQFSTQPLIERCLCDFQQGRVETIERLLPTDPAKRAECLKALVSADIQSKLSSGIEVESAGYLRLWPEVDAAWLTQMVANVSEARVPKQSVHESNHPVASSEILLNPNQWEYGHSVGQFKIVSKIGEGSHGLVFLADDVHLHRRVAIKVSPDCGIEGKVLARLHHPNIVKIHGQFVHGVYRCLVMPFIQGPSLVDLLKKEPYADSRQWDFKKVKRWVHKFRESKYGRYLHDDLTSKANSNADLETIASTQSQPYTALIVNWILCISRALHHAHSRGVLHRDIKPSNVILDAAGSPMLMDFNVAAIDSAKDTHDQTSFGGTLSYMAPEHVRAFETASGEEDVDTRSDLFSLGIVFVELLTGRKVWSSQSELADLLGSSSIPRTLQPVLVKCVQPDPADRYQGAHELIRDLEAWLTKSPLFHARPNGWNATVIDWTRRHTKSLGVAAVFVAAAAGLIGAGNLRAKSVIERSRELTKVAEEQIQVGSLVEAFNTIGEAKGLIASAPAVQLIRPTDSEQLHERWNRLLLAGKAARLDAQLELQRRNQIGSPLLHRTKSVSSGFANDALAEYRILFEDDWEKQPPFADLAPEQRTRVTQQLTELILLLGLQRERMTETQREKWAVVRSRLPASYRDSDAFKLLEQSVVEELEVGKITANADSFEKYLLGIVLLDRDEYSAARELFQASRMKSSGQLATNYWCLYWEALACHELGLKAEASVLYGACLGKAPSFTWPYINLCLLYAETDDLALARGFIEQAIVVDPKSGIAQETRAAICLKQQDFTAARKSIETAEDLGYDSEKIRVYRNILDNQGTHNPHRHSDLLDGR